MVICSERESLKGEWKLNSHLLCCLILGIILFEPTVHHSELENDFEATQFCFTYSSTVQLWQSLNSVGHGFLISI